MDPAPLSGQKDAGFIRSFLEDKLSLIQKVTMVIDEVPGIEPEKAGYPVRFFGTQIDIARLLAALVALLAPESLEYFFEL